MKQRFLDVFFKLFKDINLRAHKYTPELRLLLILNKDFFHFVNIILEMMSLSLYNNYYNSQMNSTVSVLLSQFPRYTYIPLHETLECHKRCAIYSGSFASDL